MKSRTVKTRRARFRVPVCRATGLVLVAIALTLSHAEAQNLRGLLDEVVRGAARVGDDVPIKSLDDVATDLMRSRAAREAAEAELRKGAKMLDSRSASRALSHTDEVVQALRRICPELDPKIVRRVSELDKAQGELAVLLAKGGRDVAEAVPDIALRSQLLKQGGPELVAAAGLHGPDAVRAATRLDAALKAGNVVMTTAARPVTLADFVRVMTQGGKSSWKFWNTYVKPHWKIWAGSGALALYLINPEAFQDAAGNLTEAGFQHLASLTGAVSAGVIRGVGKGTAHATEQVTDAVADTFVFASNRLYAIVGTLAMLAILSLYFPRIRWYVTKPLRWLQQTPETDGSLQSADTSKPMTASEHVDTSRPASGSQQ